MAGKKQNVERVKRTKAEIISAKAEKEYQKITDSITRFEGIRNRIYGISGADFSKCAKAFNGMLMDVEMQLNGLHFTITERNESETPETEKKSFFDFANGE